MTVVRLSTIAFGLLLALVRTASAMDYHVSPTGDDSASGSLAAPWQSIDRVNATILQPGDRVLFEGGAVHAGNLAFTSEDAGTPAMPIVVDAYGTGRAILDAGSGKGISVYNTSGIELRNLVVRGGWDADRQAGNTSSGIELYVDLPGTTRLPHVVIEDCEVSGFHDAGIAVAAWAGDLSFSGFTNVRIERCDSHDNGHAGITSWGMWEPAASDHSHRDLVVRDSRAYRNRGIVGHSNNTGSGIVLSAVNGALIEGCEAFDNGDLCDHRGGGPVGIWAWDARAVVIQGNESHHNRTGAMSLDGGGFDLDGGVTDSVMQYNYSHDNDGAGYLVYQFWGARPSLSGNVIRYNISQDDGRQHGYGGIYVGGGSDVHDNVFHSNTIFVSSIGNPGTAGIILDGVGPGNAFHDNCVITTGGVPLVRSDRAYARTDAVFQGNAWWAGDPADWLVRWGSASHPDLGSWRAAGQETFGATPTGLDADPLLRNPGGGGTVGDPALLTSLDAYDPLPGSPLIDAGLDLVTIFGLDPGPRDFAGTALPSGAAFEIGAVEARTCTRPPPVGELRVDKPSAAIRFAWSLVPAATTYNVRQSLVLPDAFDTLLASGASGMTQPMPPESLVFFVVAAENACGEGPR